MKTLPVFLIIFTVILSIFPTLYQRSQATPSTYFPLVHNNVADYYSYLQYMRQGYEGNWKLTTRYSQEHFTPQFANTFFALLGHFSRIFSLSLPATYTLARIVLGTLILVVVYYIIGKLYSNRLVQCLACFFAFLGTSFWWYIFPGGHGVYIAPMSFWTGVDAVQRTTFLPHHLAATFLVILSLLILSFAITKVSKTIFVVAFLLVLATLANPAVVFCFFFILAVFFCLFTMTNRTYKTHKRQIAIVFFNIVFMLMMVLVPLFHLYRVSHSTQPWTVFTTWEAKVVYPVTLSGYILMLGPSFIFSLFAAPLFLRKKSALHLFILSWGIAPFLPLFLFKMVFTTVFPISNMRFLQASHYIPIGIMAGYGFVEFVRIFGRVVRLPRFAVGIPLFIIILGYSAFSWYRSIYKEINRWTPNVYNIYLPREYMTGFDFLNTHTPKESVVVSGAHLGLIIPGFTHNRVLFGQPVLPDALNKENLTNTFLAQNDSAFATAFLHDYHIDYLFFADDTGNPNDAFLQQIGAKPVFRNTRIAIYQTKKVN